MTLPHCINALKQGKSVYPPCLPKCSDGTQWWCHSSTATSLLHPAPIWPGMNRVALVQNPQRLSPSHALWKTLVTSFSTRFFTHRVKLRLPRCAAAQWFLKGTPMPTLNFFTFSPHNPPQTLRTAHGKDDQISHTTTSNVLLKLLVVSLKQKSHPNDWTLLLLKKLCFHYLNLKMPESSP